MLDKVLYGALFGFAPLFYGHVVDFFHVVFDVNIFGYYIDSFPIFNIADIAVSLGVAVLFIFYGKEEHEVAAGETSDGEMAELNKSGIDSDVAVETDIEGKSERPVRKISLPTETENEISEEPADGKDNNRKDI